MKKIVFFLFLVLLITGFAAAQASAGGTMYVAINTIDLKSGTGLFANTVGQLKQGDRVTVIQVSGRFLEIQSAANSSIKGWVPTADLSARQVVAGTSSTATAREVAMAGKGFNQEVETSYRSTNAELNYEDVDRVEAITVNQTDLERFLREGRLASGDK